MPLLDLLYPRTCAACDAAGRSPLCARCEAGVAWIERACRRCALPVAPGGGRHVCIGAGCAFDAAASAAIYRGAARDAVIRFKVAGEHRAASALSHRMLPAVRRLDVPAGAVVTFVPSGRAAMRERGRNPAALLARRLALRSGMPAAALLAKTRETRDLAGLGRDARRRALGGAFAAVRAVPRDVLLVDDVLTTGATASACAAALKARGARLVFVATFARAP